MKLPPRTIKLTDLSAFLLEFYNFKVSRRTTYEWVKAGPKRECLEARQVKNPLLNHRYPNMRVTTEKWVVEFLTRTGHTPVRIK